MFATRFATASVLTMLCDVCEDTLSRMLDSSEKKVDHHSTHANLASSATDGCLICSDIMNDIEEWNHRLGQHPPHPLTSWTLDCEEDRKKTMQVDVYLHDYDKSCCVCSAESSSHLVKSYDFTPVTTHAHLGDRQERRFPTVFSDYTGSAETTSHITNWMNQCMETHDVCKEGREGMWMPSRLLEISNVHGDLHLRLRDRSELRISHYCTLSHRWNSSGMQGLQLTTSSLSSFRNGISVSTLRPTFKDMADLTWRLGARLMWIDCMCIVQDDIQDWRNESAVMGKVYANSWLNVSANARDTSRSGLYAERNVSRHLAHFRTRYDGSREETTWTVTTEDEWLEEVEYAPVNKRAWVLQERILSPRIVHMSPNQVLWECRQLQASEHFPYGESAYGHSFDSQSKMKRICYGGQDQDKHDVLADWDHLVPSYTRSGLTFETDRLIALSGIASMVHKRTQCDYLAGIWIKALPTGLLWSESSFPLHEPSAKITINGDGSKEYIAPSWSWASTPAFVGFPRINNGKSRSYAAILRYETTLANPADKFGAILDGTIELRAPLGTMSWVERYDKNVSGYYITDITIWIPMGSGRTEIIAQSSPTDRNPQLFLDRKEYQELQTAYFTVIRTQSEASQLDLETGIWSPGYNVQGLLLKRLPCSRYVRIGVALFRFDTEQDFVSKMPEQDVIII